MKALKKILITHENKLNSKSLLKKNKGGAARLFSGRQSVSLPKFYIDRLFSVKKSLHDIKEKLWAYADKSHRAVIVRRMKSTAVITALSLTLCACESYYSDYSNYTDYRDEKITETNSSFSKNNEFENINITSEYYSDKYNITSEKPMENSEKIPEGRGMFLSLNKENELEINRIALSEKPYNKDEIWTVFVYICAGNLESVNSSASKDMEEMRVATERCPKLRFVVEADSTEEWHNDICENGKKQRILISGGEYELIYSGESTDMGDPDALTDFLEQGLAEYGSDYNSLVFWNHGGGSISGVCFDDAYNKDSLTLKEIDNALSLISENMTHPFELIGFDACLMSTIESADILATYANYMIASQETESAYGWDYTSFAEAIADGAENGGEIGKYLCESYYQSCTYTGEDYTATLSVIDLSKIDDFLVAFNRHCIDVYSYIYSENGLADVIKAAESTLKFGSNNRTEGYTNMIDLYGFINNTLNFSENASEASKLLEDCVIYAKNGEEKAEAGGLSVFYPLNTRSGVTLNILSDICVSPYYISIVDICAFGKKSNGNIEEYNFNRWLNDDADFWSDSDIDFSEYDYWNGSSDKSLNSNNEKAAVSFLHEPAVDENGVYSFTLTEESFHNLSAVYSNIMLRRQDPENNKEYMMDLGTDNYVYIDYTSGKCSDLFDGIWFALPDGQPICTYLIESTCKNDTFYNIYTAPVILNGQNTNLRILREYSDSDETNIISIIGALDDISEGGSAPKSVYKLKKGDVIRPCYDVYDAQTLEYAFDISGEDYVCDGELKINYDYLFEGDYYYSFEIEDCYENSIYTDFVMFGMEIDEDGELKLFHY